MPQNVLLALVNLLEGAVRVRGFLLVGVLVGLALIMSLHAVTFSATSGVVSASRSRAVDAPGVHYAHSTGSVLDSDSTKSVVDGKGMGSGIVGSLSIDYPGLGCSGF